MEPPCDLVKPAQDGARKVAAEQVVAAGGAGDDVRGRRCKGEVSKHALGRIAVACKVDEIEPELARKLRRRSATAHAGVVVDGDAVPQREIGAHRNELHRCESEAPPGIWDSPNSALRRSLAELARVPSRPRGRSGPPHRRQCSPRVWVPRASAAWDAI